MHDYTPPPSSICFSHDDWQENDDASELTGPCNENDNNFTQEEDDFRITKLALAADPNKCHPNNNLDDGKYLPSQELIEIRRYISKLQDKVNDLSSKLDRCETENKTLKAEMSVLVDKLALAPSQDHQPDNTTRRLPWSTKKGDGGNGGAAAAGGGGSMQMLIDANSKLMTENARLQVVADTTRKSLQSYILDMENQRDKDKQIIDTLIVDNELLQQRLTNPEINLRLSYSDRTARSSLESSFNDRKYRKLLESDHTTAETSLRTSMTEMNLQQDDLVDCSHRSSIRKGSGDMLRNSLHSIPEQDLTLLGTSGDDWIMDDGEEDVDTIIETWKTSRNCTALPELKDETSLVKGRSKSCDLLVNFGRKNRCSAAAAPRRFSQSFTLGRTSSSSSSRSIGKIEACQKPGGDLLLDFGKRPTPQCEGASTRRRFSYSMLQS